MAVNGYLAAFNATPVHNFAHAFGAMYHIPHGDANAALLPIVMESLSDFYSPNAERLAQGLNMPENGKSGAELLTEVIATIRELQAQIGCATDFKRWLSVDERFISERERARVAQIIEKSRILKTVATMRQELVGLWQRSSATKEQLVRQLEDWCRRAGEAYDRRRLGLGPASGIAG